MRHLIVAATMFFVALGITFGAASVLEVVAVAQSHRAQENVVVQAAKPAYKSVAGKQRILSEREGFMRSSANVAGL